MAETLDAAAAALAASDEERRQRGAGSGPRSGEGSWPPSTRPQPKASRSSATPRFGAASLPWLLHSPICT